MESILKIADLEVSVDDTQILQGVNLSVGTGEIHAIMGPNGSGKSTLSLTIMGHPKYTVTNGSILLENNDITKLPVDQRSKKGIFLAFQNPLEIEGVTVREFLYQAHRAQNPQATLDEFEDLLIDCIKKLDIKPEFIERSLNLGFSGGEKKRIETLQLAILGPKLAILDEIDSGLDIDALKIICKKINLIREKNKNMSLLIITHYPRILHYLSPDFVHIMQDGKIVQSGTKELALEIEKEGYPKDFT